MEFTNQSAISLENIVIQYFKNINICVFTSYYAMLYFGLAGGNTKAKLNDLFG